MGARMVPDVGDEAWTEEDRVAVLVWQDAQAGKCSGCGLPSAETFDIENQYAYTAHPLRCHACAAREEAAANWNGKGTYWRVDRD